MDCKGFTGILVLLVATARSQSPNQESYDYCDPSLKLCEVPTEHTMCKYPVPGRSPQCTQSIDEPLLQNEKDKILFWHNKFRSYIASEAEKNKTRKLPTSSNMRQMYWDSELESIATRWAEQCTSMTNPAAYDKCRNTKRFQVSQNVGTRRVNGTAIDKQAPQIVITWYKENKGFDPALVDRFVPAEDDKVSVKQFANMIWADTCFIGCARVIFQEKLPTAERESKSSVWTIERLVCNYGPAGNEIGKPIYKRGIACENCPDGTECSRVFPGLCAIQANQSTSKAEKTRVSTKDHPPTVPTTEKQVAEETSAWTTPRQGGDSRGSHRPDQKIRSFNPAKRLPQPTARELGLGVPAQGDDISIGKWKWIVSNSAKVRRDNARQMGPKNGDACQCYIRATDSEGSASARINAKPFLLLLSSLIPVEAFLLSTFYHCK